MLRVKVRIAAILGRLISRSTRREAAFQGRLSPERAAEIAVAAAAEAGFPDTIGVASPIRTESGLFWDVCQLSRGSGWRVVVDDATGQPGAVGRWGLR
ncbi:hypothetical protein [Methylorubrum extorquens]|uniref:hypothetical protein n=1 Tax=Methylorubrum extorquens TaxID=408 RepID=UPI00209EC314|nr:hypothetical protein [Methylorubrum extorquens]MCP1549636.1 hypothetical protein [Methylorubrum zatmanii]MCP1553750.1 hypothetical protein [Methylorubrum extorquens]MCP1579938.1 hypothetical protein [Methylorubrum extorquens]